MPSTLPPWAWGADAWRALGACVADTYAPFDVTITDAEPGDIDVMVAGTAADLGLPRSGGLAPFIGCEPRGNAIAFAFAGETSQIDFLCAAVAQESAHVLGLDHELDARDPMSYLDLGARKTFQDVEVDCGEDAPRPCYCGGPTQNSYRRLAEVLGEQPAGGCNASHDGSPWLVLVALGLLVSRRA